MREMKDSGVKWIEEIPTTWKIVPLKSLFSFGKGLPITKDNLEDTGIPVISYGQIHAKWNSGVTTHRELLRFVNESYLETNPQSLVRRGDLIMADTSEDREGCGNCAYVDTDEALFAGYHTIILRSISETDNKYLAYLFLTDPWRSQIRKAVSGVKLFSISRRILGSVSVIVPDNANEIVAYLDDKCAQVNTLIANVQAQIEKLKAYKQSLITEVVTKGLDPTVPMKDSVVEWIGVIPAHWTECRIKNAVFPQEKGILPSDQIITCFRDGEVTLRSKRREDGFTVSLTEHGYHGVDIGDLVIHGMDAFAGAIGCSDSRGKTTPVVHVCNTIGNNRYFMYYLRAMAYGNILMDLSNGVRIRSSDYRNFARLGVFGITVPPRNEQDKIAEYLDKKCGQIEQLIAIKQAKIEKLEQYKKSLIYEYVTGKKEVPTQA